MPLDVTDLVVFMSVWDLTGGSRFARMAHSCDETALV